MQPLNPILASCLICCSLVARLLDQKLKKTPQNWPFFLHRKIDPFSFRGYCYLTNIPFWRTTIILIIWDLKMRCKNLWPSNTAFPSPHLTRFWYSWGSSYVGKEDGWPKLSKNYNFYLYKYILCLATLIKKRF
jgi:hypothetical protein